VRRRVEPRRAEATGDDRLAQKERRSRKLLLPSLPDPHATKASGRCSALSGSVFHRCRDQEVARPAQLPRHRLANWECWGRRSSRWFRWSRLWNCLRGRHRCAVMSRNSSARRSCRSCGSGPTPCRWKPAAPSRPVLLRIFSWNLLLLRRRSRAVNAGGE
jgi:hypothetical protein